MRAPALLPFVAAWFLTALAAQGIGGPWVITAYQGPCQEGDFNANLATARAIVQQARERRSDFLAFPECFLSGYESRQAVERGARPINDPALQAFIRETEAHDVVVIIGMARQEGAQRFNSALVIHRGRLLGIHDKAMLTSGDRDELGFTAGRNVQVFEAHGLRFGVLLCADTSYPYVAMASRLQGAQILFAPHYNAIGPETIDAHRRWVRNCHVGLACQLQCVVVRANIVRADRPGRVSYGDSFILSPQGEPLAEGGLFRTCLISTTVDATLYRPPVVWADLQDAPAWLRTQTADLLTSFRKPSNDAELRSWLTNMVELHNFSPREISDATGLSLHEIDEAIRRLGLRRDGRRENPSGARIQVVPYPGGRHPRRGFFDGAINPQRETKVSVFTPWAGGGYVVVDVPEAIFSNLGLTYLAHTHIPTLWDQQGITLPRLEWEQHADGRLTMERELPNGIAFGTTVLPGNDGVRFELWLRNGTDAGLSGLRVQNCVMLGAAPAFASQTLTNKVFSAPFAAVRSAEGNRWIITAWERCGRAWGNTLVPCVHSDPVFPDCPPGNTVRLHGWLSFHEGADIEREFARLQGAGVLRSSE